MTYPRVGTVDTRAQSYRESHSVGLAPALYPLHCSHCSSSQPVSLGGASCHVSGDTSSPMEKPMWKGRERPFAKSKELRPPDNSCVNDQLRSEPSSPIQAFRRLRPQSRAWLWPHERSWSRNTQLRCYWISNTQKFYEIMFVVPNGYIWGNLIHSNK